MDMTKQSGFLTSNHNNHSSVTTEFSEKAKAFSIDALLSTDKTNKEPVIRRKLPFHKQILHGRRQCGYGNNINTPDKEQKDELSHNITYEKVTHGLIIENMKSASKQANYLIKKETVDSPQHLNFNSPSAGDIPYYNPLMTGGFFRPVECYSPMSYEGQSTPAGLKTLFQSPFPLETMQQSVNYCSDNTPDHKRTIRNLPNEYLIPKEWNLLNEYSTPNDWNLHNEYSTPKHKHGIPVTGGRKISSSRRHERPHPYLSTRVTPVRENLSTRVTPVREDIEKVTQELQNVESKVTTVKGKRHRTAFTQEQLQCLEAEFDKQQYLVGEERVQLAESLNLKVSHVKVWFQNRRIKWRKEQFGQ